MRSKMQFTPPSDDARNSIIQLGPPLNGVVISPLLPGLLPAGCWLKKTSQRPVGRSYSLLIAAGPTMSKEYLQKSQPVFRLWSDPRDVMATLPKGTLRRQSNCRLRRGVRFGESSSRLMAGVMLTPFLWRTLLSASRNSCQ